MSASADSAQSGGFFFAASARLFFTPQRFGCLPRCLRALVKHMSRSICVKPSLSSFLTAFFPERAGKGSFFVGVDRCGVAPVRERPCMLACAAALEFVAKVSRWALLAVVSRGRRGEPGHVRQLRGEPR